MNANLNSISPLLSDLKTVEDKPARLDPKKDDGPSFNSVLSKAQEKEKPKTPVNETKATPHESESPNEPVVAENVTQDPDKKTVDDKTGVVAKSFDHMAVSYPVSRIAKESLDEKTVTNLKDQGLWEIPSMVMAEPSQKLALMKDAIGKLGDVKAKEALPVAKPLAQFMASLESELGVKPDRLIQAFKKLSPDQLQKSPKETMSQVVKNLGLSPKDEIKATELFTKLLSEMETVRNQSMNPALMAAVAGGATLNATPVDKVNDKAIVKGRTHSASARYAQNLAPDKSLKTESMTEPREVVKENNQPQMNLSKTELKDSKAETQQQSSAPFAPVPQNQAESSVNVLAQPETHGITPDTFKANSLALQAKASGVDEKDVKDLGKAFKDTKVSVKSVSTSQNATSQVAANDFAPAKAEIPGQPVVASGVAAGELKAGEDSKHEAIRSIVNQAQMLAQKGGGEIRMSLKPDHLGEIQLKVAMEGNRVNVQMTTERGEVKKLLEQSVHELRHGLASHNLNMDKLDVSVGNRETQGFLKGQPDFGAARDFANQFQQQQNNRRELLNDLNSLRGGAQKSMMAMDRQAQAQRVMGSGSSSGRLNVVA